MHETILRGTSAQMGIQDGEIAATLGMQLPAPEAAMLDLANGCERVAIQHTHKLVEEIHAFADAAIYLPDTPSHPFCLLAARTAPVYRLSHRSLRILLPIRTHCR
jgi:hypothetical protein